MKEELPQFMRANFFNGLVATPKYWNEIQEYHHQKEIFYNRVFHGYGIVENMLGRFRIQPIHGGGGAALAIVVNSGAAIDKMGRSIYLYEPQAITIDYRKYKLPTTIYITVRYKEVMEEYYQNEDNPDYQGYRKKLESAMIEVRNTEPDDSEVIELGRIYLEEDQNGEIPAIQEAKDFSNPGPNTIDTRYISWVSIARQGLSPYLKTFLVTVLDKTRSVAQISHDALTLPGFRELQVVSLTAKMLVQCGDVRFDDVIHVLFPIFDIDNQIIQEMLDFERTEEKSLFSTKSNFENIKTAVFEMGDQLKAFNGDYATVDAIIKRHQVFIDGIRDLFITKKMSIHDIALMSYELPRILLLGDDRYTLVDYIDMRDKESVDGHRVRFENNRDTSTSNIALSYPDGQIVRDTVKRYVGGSAFFTLKNIIKKRKLLLIRRTDVVVGNYSIEVIMEKEDYKRTLTIDTADSKFRWRNCFVQFDEDDVNKHTIPVEFRMGEKGRDNFGKIWVYQRL
ncbi:hypothetical protein [Sediminispirochaeta bajacaliforniensis]|uniref:hypothetical protein n=1 Tax=Sediminispirochaeta bajacaliforniensis TaxID=148 RepID=UPI00036132BE|nr:hypothetical protein [Sediminispirochaeta bajacaliforniensis]